MGVSEKDAAYLRGLFPEINELQSLGKPLLLRH